MSSADSKAIVAALLRDAVQTQDFELALKVRNYRHCLDELAQAIADENFDKCIELKRQKVALEAHLPELETKKKQLAETPSPSVGDVKTRPSNAPHPTPPANSNGAAAKRLSPAEIEARWAKVAATATSVRGAATTDDLKVKTAVVRCSHGVRKMSNMQHAAPMKMQRKLRRVR